MKLEYVVLAAATLAAIIYYAKFDKYQPDHSEFGADYTNYSLNGEPVDTDIFEDEEDL